MRQVDGPAPFLIAGATSEELHDFMQARRDRSFSAAESLAMRRALALEASQYMREDLEHAGLASPWDAVRSYLLGLVLRRYYGCISGWRDWLRALVQALPSTDPLGRLLPAWSPWSGRAPPSVPEVTPRQ